MKLKAVVVGGGSGGKLSMNALEASDQFELAAVCDIDERVRHEAKEAHPGARTFTDHRDMFASIPADVVCVSTWPPSHLPIALDALKRPLKGLLVEKPLGDTAQAGADILDAVRERELPLVVPHGLLVARHASEIIERVHGGDIGDLQLFEVECSRWDIINAGIHWLNFFVVLTKFEPVKYVIAQCDRTTRTYRDGMQVETFAVTYGETVSGVRLIMNTGDEVTTTRPEKGILFRLVGTEGILEFWGWESSYRLVNAESPRGNTVDVVRHAKSGHQLHLEYLAGQIESGRRDYRFPDSSLRALELVEAAYLSGRHHCRVDLPLDRFSPPDPVDWDPGKPYNGSGGGRNGRKLDG